MPQCTICSNKFPNRVTIDGKVRVLNSRKYCLTCSPFKQHNTKKLESARSPYHCTRCSRDRTKNDFYAKRNGKGRTWYCKECLSEQYSERHEAFKQECVDYLGGKCKECNYNRCLAALEFHHRDANEKDFNIASVRKRNLDLVKSELDKCDLLCCRCHREIHHLASPVGIEPTLTEF